MCPFREAVRRTITLPGLVICGLCAAASAALAQNITITSPFSGENFSPGAQVSITAQAINGFAPAIAFASTPETTAPLNVPQLSGTITLPTEAAGSVPVVVYASDANGNLQMDQVSVNVSSFATLTGLTADPSRITISGLVPPTQQITVTGTYSGGSTLDITASGSGTSYSSENTAIATVSQGGLVTAVGTGITGITISNQGQQVLVPVNVTVQPGVLVASVLPASRSVQVGNPATAFATIINTGAAATSCSLSPVDGVPATFAYQTTNQSNQLTGSANTPVNIAAGGSQSFVFSELPSAAFGPLNLGLYFTCTNTTPVTSVAGLNTLLLSASATPVPDIVALAASGDPGIVDIPGTSGTGVFAVATVNVGVAGTITATANTGSATLPVSLFLCQTVPSTGACMQTLSTSVTTTIAANATPTFGIFVAGNGSISFDPANSRIFVQFADTTGTIRGSTSVAVRTQ